MATSTSKVQESRDKYMASGIFYGCTHGLELLDGHMRMLMEDKLVGHQRPVSAVDLVAGCGVMTASFALRYRQPAFPATLEFIPADPKPQVAKLGFQEMAQEVANDPLFDDPEGLPVYAGSHVVLRGLSNDKFNNREGKVIEKDAAQEGRFAVLLLDEKRDFETKPISVKGDKMYSMPSEVGNAVLHNAMTKEEQQEFFQELSKRTCQYNLAKLGNDEIGLVQVLRGKCALVTCIDPKSRYPASTWPGGKAHWYEAMSAASHLLMEGGCFVIMDYYKGIFHDEGDHYGNIGYMEKLVYEDNMSMYLESNNPDFIQGNNGQGEKVAMLWRKGVRNYDRFNGESDMLRKLQWHPVAPPPKKKDGNNAKEVKREEDGNTKEVKRES